MLFKKLSEVIFLKIDYSLFKVALTEFGNLFEIGALALPNALSSCLSSRGGGFFASIRKNKRASIFLVFYFRVAYRRLGIQVL